MLASGTPVGADRYFVGIQYGEFAVVVLQAIWSRQSTGCDDRDNDAVGSVSSGVVKKRITHSKQHTPVVKCVLDFVQLTSLLIGGDEVLPPILDPLDRSAELDGGKGCK